MRESWGRIQFCCVSRVDDRPLSILPVHHWGQHFLLANEGKISWEVIVKNKICGIYVIKNTVNDLCYVGQSIDILTRWVAHKNAAKNKKDSSHYVKIHQAMNNIGIDNFYLEILEECPYEKLDDREIYWIKKLDSYNNGYNMTTGGQGNTSGENNGRVILTEIQVTEIRMAYNIQMLFHSMK